MPLSGPVRLAWRKKCYFFGFVSFRRLKNPLIPAIPWAPFSFAILRSSCFKPPKAKLGPGNNLASLENFSQPNAEFLLITFFIQFLGPIGGLMIFLGGNSLSVMGSYYIFNIYNYLIDPISPLVICLLAYLVVTFFNFLFTELERSKVRNAFSQYMSPVMVEKLAKSSESLKLGGERKEMTFLFSDIRGFTSISEKYKDDPEALTDLINNLLTVLSNEILTTQGTIDKFWGNKKRYWS